MLPLESPRWSKITGAYGPASDIPALLEKAAQLPPSVSVEDEPYFSLWSALCHQGDVYAASYAALPHLVEILRANPDHIEVTLMDIVGRIEVARLQNRGPSMPEDLSTSYFAALAILPDLAARLLSEPRSEGECRIIFGALSAAKGHPRLAAAVVELTPDIVGSLLERWIFE